MPLSNYLKITVGDQSVQVTNIEELPISINYSLEDPENFQNKTSSISYDVEIPANLNNEKVSNTFRNPDVEDLTLGQVFKSNQKVIVESNGYEILNGKAFLKKATHNAKPLSYLYNFFGDNADWLITLKDKTLFDFVKDITFTFDKTTIQNSWNADGTDESQQFVFAPVRYRFPFNDYFIDGNGNSMPDDDNVSPTYMRPSLFKYWILFNAFKSVGYRIVSNFMDDEYFRRQVMPWTWGNFLDSGGTKLDSHKFLAKSVEDKYFEADRGRNGKIDEYVDIDASNDSTNGAFDNNDDYSYDSGTFEMKWEYKIPDYGSLTAAFSSVIFYSAAISGNNSDMEVDLDWFVNGVFKQRSLIMKADSSGIVYPIPIGIGTLRPAGQTEVFFNTEDYGVSLNNGDIVSAKVHVRLYRDKSSINDVCHVALNVLQFQLDYFRIPLGGTIDFNSYTSFQKYKFIDYFAGIIDEFDLSFNTDPISKIIYIEPTHPYSKTNDLSNTQDGYFKNDFIDWNGKEDLSKEWEIENFSDTEKELTFKYKNDTSDGILKLIQDRNVNILSAGKYVFPDRFQTGSRDRENRFFAPTMHYSLQQWEDIGTGSNSGITPQIVCIIPENVSNTSESESDNTFIPKSCYYKGNITGAGAWRFDGDVLQSYPYMFSVNYQPGGEEDPILSYCDENINGVIGKGLLRRFFWQRLAILRNGQRYTSSWFKLKNIDVANQIHREFKSYKGQKWELIQIKDFKPLSEESCSCLLYKWSPITQDDFDKTFPTETSINTGNLSGELDIKYAQLKCLISDIPK